MNRILFHLPGADHGKLFSPDARDHISEPFIHLRERLRDMGYQMDTADLHPVDDCARVILWDLEGFDSANRLSARIRRFAKQRILRRKRRSRWRNSRTLFEDCQEAGAQSRAILILGEPEVVLPANWKPKFHKPFSRILTWHDSLVNGSRYQKLHWPIPASHPEVPDIPFRDRKLLVNISGNKFSSHTKELYSARRETIRHFERSHPDQFDLFGVGWNSPEDPEGNYSSYRGIVKDKWEVFPRYKYGICYENMRDEPGWITEKIFDCLRAGSVPIYWGAPNINDYVDREAFVDRTRFGSEAELASYLADLPEVEYQKLRTAGQDYLRSDRFKAFLSPAFADSVIRRLEL